MKPSRLNRQISVLRKSTSKDSRGGEVVEWIPLVALPGSPLLPERWWAEVQDVLPSRAEKVEGAVALGEGMTRIRMRYRIDIDATMRITVHGDIDQTFEIRSGPAEIGGPKDRIEMMCERYSTKIDPPADV
jgi:head-tail adaptor